MPRAKKTTKRAVTSTKTSSDIIASKSSKAPERKIPLSGIILAAIVLVIILALGYFKNQFIVASVNGQPITRVELLMDLEKKQGKADLDNLITEKLINQEAVKRKITVSDGDVALEIGNIEKNIKGQGQNLDSLLAQQNLTRADLSKQVRLQVLLKKMVKPITVTDKEVQDYLDQNKDSIPQGTDPTTLKNQVKQQIQQQKQGSEVQTLVSELQQKAKIDYLLKL